MLCLTNKCTRLECSRIEDVKIVENGDILAGCRGAKEEYAFRLVINTLGILFDNVCLVHGMRIGSDDQTIVLMF